MNVIFTLQNLSFWPGVPPAPPPHLSLFQAKSWHQQVPGGRHSEGKEAILGSTVSPPASLSPQAPTEEGWGAGTPPSHRAPPPRWKLTALAAQPASCPSEGHICGQGTSESLSEQMFGLWAPGGWLSCQRLSGNLKPLPHHHACPHPLAWEAG